MESKFYHCPVCMKSIKIARNRRSKGNGGDHRFLFHCDCPEVHIYGKTRREVIKKLHNVFNEKRVIAFGDIIFHKATKYIGNKKIYRVEYDSQRSCRKQCYAFRGYSGIFLSYTLEIYRKGIYLVSNHKEHNLSDCQEIWEIMYRCENWNSVGKQMDIKLRKRIQGQNNV